MKKRSEQQFRFDFLDPAAVRLVKGPAGGVRMILDGGDRSYLKVMVARAFPMSEPSRHVGFLDGNGKDIGIIEDIRKLDPESRRIAEEELDKRYFMPKILRVLKLNHEYDISYFLVETDRGQRDFTVRGHHENCVEVSPDRYIIEDVDGSRFEIPDVNRLDARSQSLLARVL